MKEFASLFRDIESTNSTNQKISFLQEYFNNADDKDKLWVVALFTHRRPKRIVNTRTMREWAAEMSHIPIWLFEDTYHIVGDLAETIAKVVPGGKRASERSLSDWVEALTDIKDKEESVKKRFITEAWQSLNETERLLLNKLITGGFRMGVSQKTIVKALAKHLGQDPSSVAHRIMGNWTPWDTDFNTLLVEQDTDALKSKPYPFYLAYPLQEIAPSLGAPSQWTAEYKWDGIRGQLIKRNGEIFLWSRGEELITHQFPEFDCLLDEKEDFVLDGEILVYREGQIKNFNNLQKRLGRKKPGKKILKDYSAILMAYDIMEFNGKDLRHLSQSRRRQKLENWYDRIDNKQIIHLSPQVNFKSWDELDTIRSGAREKAAEGLMLKSVSGAYKTGRKKGDWYKWKLDPLTVDAVMIYAQRGHGRRANLFTDFTFALRDGDRLVPVAKAYSGLTDAEFREISSFVRRNTIERFGPVCSVPAEQVFEIAFENVAHSSRHKSGVALRFPRIVRWRRDKPVEEIDNLDVLKSMIKD